MRVIMPCVVGCVILSAGCSVASADDKPAAQRGTGSSVKSFGAVGDGKADDTAAIQQAVKSGVGSVRFTRGVYRITKPIVVDLDKVGFTSIISDGTARIVMAGAGPALHFIGTHEGTAAPSSFKDNVWQNQRTPIVDAIEIVGDHPLACGVEATGTMQLTLSRLVVRKALHAIHLTRRNRNVIISDCHLYENRGIGVFYDNVDLHQSNIIGSHISYNDGGGIVSRGGNVRNIHIGTCDIESNHGADSPPTANVLIDCTGSTHGAAEVAITGCTIQHNSNSPESANIRIIGRTDPRDEVELQREGNVTIVANVLSDVQTNIHLRDCRGVVISDNTFWMGFDHNLLIEDCSNIVVGANNFDRNPRYDYGRSKQAANAIIIRDSEDCTLSGLHVSNIWNQPAGLVLENCRRFNLTNFTILDCDNIGLLLRNVSHSRVSGGLIRNDRPEAKLTDAIRIIGGEGNLVTGNLLGGRLTVESGRHHVRDNVGP